MLPLEELEKRIASNGSNNDGVQEQEDEDDNTRTLF